MENFANSGNAQSPEVYEKLCWIISKYKEKFAELDNNERYKWEALYHYKKYWKIDAPDFAAMVAEAFRYAGRPYSSSRKGGINDGGNLLTAYMYYAYNMLVQYAKAEPETVRELFRTLYNEEIPLTERYNTFRSTFEKYAKSNGKGNNSYQDLHAISVYLTFEYPDKYFIYKSRMAASFQEYIGYKDAPSALTGDLKKFENYTRMCEFVLSEAQKDPELIKMNSRRAKEGCYTDEFGCYDDKPCHLLTMDIVFYAGAYLDWYPSDKECLYTLSVNDWDELLKNSEIFNQNSMQIMACMKDSGGTVSCAQLAKKYGDTPDFYRETSLDLAKRICEKKNIEPCKDKNEQVMEWSVLYEARPAPCEPDGALLFKLRKNLEKALELKKIHIEDHLIDEDDNMPNTSVPYTEDDFLREVYMAKENYIELKDLLINKKNIILQGAPGVGKTFCAKRLAWSMMGEKDDSRIEFVQFHQSYSYEQFVMGYRPTEGSFELRNGVFYRFCKKAANQPGKDFFFIIDEINRGNMSKIFGELLMLIEKDYRGEEKVKLPYTDEYFTVPENLYIIGMMNTADRSLAIIDYALRRRFSFYDMEPAFDTESFKTYQRSLENASFDCLIGKIKTLNQEIKDDSSLGKGYKIGHSYFCGKTKDTCTSEWMLSVVKYDIYPIFAEYWFDVKNKPEEKRDELLKVIENDKQ